MAVNQIRQGERKKANDVVVRRRLTGATGSRTGKTMGAALHNEGRGAGLAHPQEDVGNNPALWPTRIADRVPRSPRVSAARHVPDRQIRRPTTSPLTPRRRGT